MSTFTVKDGTEIYYKDWGKGQPIVFHHGWPLSSDDWDSQMMFFLQKGYRVIAHDRRGHGRSGQASEGNNMETYASDIAELTEALDLKDAIHVGHSTGGGEVIRYAAKYGKGRVAKAVIISAVTPIMVQNEANPEGVPLSVFDEIRKGTGFNRAQYFYDFPIPFYGWNREGQTVQEGIKQNWWRQGMMGSVLSHYEGIKAFSESDFTEDLKSLDIPVLVLHGEDDQIVPYAQAPRAAKLLKNSKLISYPGFSHGMPTINAETINNDILDFIK
ncbi:non-heme chloroperoxidase [Flavobacterium nitrogenifigens]|uniref:Non-heme chloroperoxidase n=2 Tax=Flavobacterium TaxID=237 RepID=A0A7W7N978_9FLAO|nr:MULTISPECIES: alpha/beta hydrolase [Flavobacterium]MBB4804603.1 non-heme chloroperoxidase [Flavobacterium nitrogenifigens]MBB6389562.1 non-heme chloroperoxidase [Flavobacterium notoginsengisoli]